MFKLILKFFGIVLVVVVFSIGVFVQNVGGVSGGVVGFGVVGLGVVGVIGVQIMFNNSVIELGSFFFGKSMCNYNKLDKLMDKLMKSGSQNFCLGNNVNIIDLKNGLLGILLGGNGGGIGGVGGVGGLGL